MTESGSLCGSPASPRLGGVPATLTLDAGAGSALAQDVGDRERARRRHHHPVEPLASAAAEGEVDLSPAVAVGEQGHPAQPVRRVLEQAVAAADFEHHRTSGQGGAVIAP